MRLGWMIGAGLALCTAAGVQAETLPVSGIYAAGADAPSRVRSIAIADFSGRGGERLAFAIDSALRGAVIEGQPWFDLTFTAPAFGESYTYDGGLDGGAADGGPDAVLRGIGEVEWHDADSGTKQVEECVARDDNDKCIEKKKVNVPCRARHVTLRPEVRLVARDGTLLYAKGDTLTTSQRFCHDEERKPQVSAMTEELAARFAGAVRSDLAPVQLLQDIRVLESRQGMAKADQAAFKTALRLTKTDIVAACRAFDALEASNPQNITILFNIGLCHESAGDLAAAEARYVDVLAIKPGKLEPQEALARIASRRRAELQIDLHYPEQAR
ncbi:tetratricopeptide repeat protein [Erythrobacter sp. BLCC-B19]|uniref:tetratricopeptide repeat protein n=1 Tax=Erythrobacter sp. BLCC-B19 TaxID=3025315 RepID=UPI002360C68B|nr:hypothetical protein [Erythrobacter sp. BLCC-B19]WDA41015.1 hypothetical protein PS060_15900 [Erythrobacter sp. BLCC-B19]